MIGSRWFRVMFVIMVLFVLKMAWQATTMGPDDLETDLKVSELYEAYQDDRDEVVDNYGGKRINIEGKVCEILGGQRPSAVTLIGFGNSCADQRMIDCLLWTKRNYTRDYFVPNQEVVLRCHFMEDQDDPWIKLDYCRVIFAN